MKDLFNIFMLVGDVLFPLLLIESCMWLQHRSLLTPTNSRDSASTNPARISNNISEKLSDHSSVIGIGVEFRLFLFFAEGLLGMAVAGGVIIGIASIVGLGIAMAKKN